MSNFSIEFLTKECTKTSNLHHSLDSSGSSSISPVASPDLDIIKHGAPAMSQYYPYHYMDNRCLHSYPLSSLISLSSSPVSEDVPSPMSSPVFSPSLSSSPILPTRPGSFKPALQSQILNSINETPEKFNAGYLYKSSNVSENVPKSKSCHSDNKGIERKKSKQHYPIKNQQKAEIMTKSAEIMSINDVTVSEASTTQTPSKNKPPHSYVAMISMAILDSDKKKVLLGDIYQFIMDKFPYYNNQHKAWRNSIRHNLSLNECFFKNGRSDNGKGNYWSIHPACFEDFLKGDFRRRQARRRARNCGMSLENFTALSRHSGAESGYVPMTSSILPTAAHFQTSYLPSAQIPMTSVYTYPSFTGSLPGAQYFSKVNDMTSQQMLPLRHKVW